MYRGLGPIDRRGLPAREPTIFERGQLTPDRLAQGARPATALRDTQREWIGRGDSRSLPVWAAFQLFSR